jgi:hypothetical protein
MKRLLFFSIIFSFQLYAQEAKLKSVFVSANIGLYDIAQDQFEKAYSSNIGFAPAIALGLPLSTSTYLFGKVTYFSKKGVPILSTYQNQNGHTVLVTEIADGTSTFSEWIINAGFLGKIFLSVDYDLEIDGGLAFVDQTEKRLSTDKRIGDGVSVKGIMGFFTGIILERNFGKFPLSLIAEVQYNLSIPGVFSFIPNDGGLHTTLGVRYYFKERRLE